MVNSEHQFPIWKRFLFAEFRLPTSANIRNGFTLHDPPTPPHDSPSPHGHHLMATLRRFLHRLLPPIPQEIAIANVGFKQALKIARVPFPFPYVQAIHSAFHTVLLAALRTTLIATHRSPTTAHYHCSLLTSNSSRLAPRPSLTVAYPDESICHHNHRLRRLVEGVPTSTQAIASPCGPAPQPLASTPSVLAPNPLRLLLCQTMLPLHPSPSSY